MINMFPIYFLVFKLHAVRHNLLRLSGMPDVFVAVISGRSVHNVKEMVGIEGITYAGNHGLEIIHPGTKFQNTSEIQIFIAV